MDSMTALTPGLALELRICAQNVDWPLMIEAATIRWVSGQTCGLAFFRMTDAVRQRLEQVIQGLAHMLP